MRIFNYFQKVFKKYLQRIKKGVDYNCSKGTKGKKKMKIITRNYYETMNSKTLKTGKFICIGQWADGHLAYSRVDDNGNVIEDEDGRYLQIRSSNNKYIMLGI